MVLTLFVSAPITCRLFVGGHSNCDTKYPNLSITKINALNFLLLLLAMYLQIAFIFVSIFLK